MTRLLIAALCIFFAQTTAQAAGQPEFRGEWNTTCFEWNGFHHVINIEIHEDIWTFTDWHYSDAKCDSRNIVLEFQKMYQVSMDRGNWNGKTLMSYLRPYTNNLADAYNNANLCGHLNWKRGRVIEVTGLSCEGFDIPAADQMLYSIMKTEGPQFNILYFGETDPGHDGRSPETRLEKFSDQIWIRDPAS